MSRIPEQPVRVADEWAHNERHLRALYVRGTHEATLHTWAKRGRLLGMREFQPRFDGELRGYFQHLGDFYAHRSATDRGITVALSALVSPMSTGARGLEIAHDYILSQPIEFTLRTTVSQHDVSMEQATLIDTTARATPTVFDELGLSSSQLPERMRVVVKDKYIFPVLVLFHISPNVTGTDEILLSLSVESGIGRAALPTLLAVYEDVEGSTA